VADKVLSSQSIFSKVTFPYTCGIYRIRNIRNNKCYYGQSVNFDGRRSTHIRELELRSKKNKKFVSAWHAEPDKNVFVFEIVLICSEDMLTFYEQLMFDNFQPWYNAILVAGRPDPKTWWASLSSEERREQGDKIRNAASNMSEAQKELRIDRLRVSGEKYWASIDEFERDQRGIAIALAYEHTPQEEKERRIYKSKTGVKRYWDDKDQEFRDEWGRDISLRHSEKSAQQLEKESAAKRAAQLKFWDTVTDEERAKRGDSISAGFAQMLPEVAQLRAAKLSAAFSGENGSAAKLTNAQAEAIRGASATSKELAAQYGVGTRTIRDIKNGVTFKNCVTPIVPLKAIPRKIGKDGRFLPSV
jgi:group I intron endonuclease